MIKAQWTKQNNAHDAQWKAVVQIGEELGITLDKDGNVVKRTEKAQSVVPSPISPQTSGNSQSLVSDIMTELSKAMKEKNLFVFDLDGLINFCDEFRSRTIKPWNQWYIAHKKAYLRLRGLEEIATEDGKFRLKETEDNPVLLFRRLLAEHVLPTESEKTGHNQTSPTHIDVVHVPGEKAIIPHPQVLHMACQSSA